MKPGQSFHGRGKSAESRARYRGKGREAPDERYRLVAYIAIQQMENYLLIPFLMREGVNLPPALTIIAQALMALIFGFLGLLCAVPLLAATMVSVKMLYVQDVVGEPVEVFEDLDDD